MATRDSGIIANQAFGDTAEITPTVVVLITVVMAVMVAMAPIEAGTTTGGTTEMETTAAASTTAGTVAGSAPAMTMAETDKNETTIALDFNQVDIRTVLKTISEILEINFIVDDSITGTVSVLSPTEIPLDKLYNFLQSILEVKGYAAIPAGNAVKIIPRAQAIQRNLEVRIGGDPNHIPLEDAVVNQIIHLQYADATEVISIIKPLADSGAHLAAYGRTNTIVITDTSSNIHHLAKIIRELDVPGAKEQMSVLPLRYASAQALSEQITQIMQKRPGVSSGPGSKRVGQTKTGVRIRSDVRTNSLIVIANSQDTDRIRQIVEKLDVDRPRGAGNMHFVYLKNAQADEAAESLEAVLANLQETGKNTLGSTVRVTADAGTNALIVHATPQDFTVIAGIIEKLDVERERVLVELLIAEISEESLTEIGVDWQTLDKAVSDNMRAFGNTNFGVRVDHLAGNLEGLAVGAFKDIGGNVRIASILHALDKESDVNILSRPSIVANNHQQARIDVVDNIPRVTAERVTETDPSTPTVIRTIEYVDVGISLKFTPHISQAGLVRLEIDSEFSKLIESVTGLSSEETPTTANRRAQTVVSVTDGATVVIGGLIRDDKVTVEKKIPLLGDIPLLGELFKFKRDRLQKTNLLIFITPHVVADAKDYARLTRWKESETEPISQQQDERDSFSDEDWITSW